MKTYLLLALWTILPSFAAEKSCCATPSGRGALMAVATTAPPKADKPNIIYLLADNLGGNHVGWRNPEIKTQKKMCA